MSQKITAPETLTETQERILAYWREHPQATRGEIARGLGLSRETVSRLVNEEPFLARLETLHEDILGDAAGIASLAALAHMDELEKLLGADDERDRVRAAEMILVMAADPAERQLKAAPDREGKERVLEALERMAGKWRELSGASPIEDEWGGRELTETERRVIEYKLAHPEATQGAMARALRLSREHVNRILGEEAVRSELQQITAAALGEADKVTNTLTRAAVVELDRIARDGNARTTARLRAMKCLRRFAAEVQALGQRKEKPLDLARMTAEGVTSYSKALRALGHEVYKAVGHLLGPRSEDGEDEGPPDYAAALEDLPAELRTALRQALLTDPERLRVVIPEHVMEIVEPLLVPPA